MECFAGVVLNGKNSEWRRISAGIPQGSVLGPLFFLLYINDLVENINSDVKLSVDDTSLFSVVQNVTRSADELNRKSAIVGMAVENAI